MIMIIVLVLLILANFISCRPLPCSVLEPENGVIRCCSFNFNKFGLEVEIVQSPPDDIQPVITSTCETSSCLYRQKEKNDEVVVQKWSEQLTYVKSFHFPGYMKLEPILIPLGCQCISANQSRSKKNIFQDDLVGLPEFQSKLFSSDTLQQHMKMMSTNYTRFIRKRNAVPSFRKNVGPEKDEIYELLLDLKTKIRNLLESNLKDKRGDFYLRGTVNYDPSNIEVTIIPLFHEISFNNYNVSEKIGVSQITNKELNLFKESAPEDKSINESDSAFESKISSVITQSTGPGLFNSVMLGRHYNLTVEMTNFLGISDYESQSKSAIENILVISKQNDSLTSSETSNNISAENVFDAFQLAFVNSTLTQKKEETTLKLIERPSLFESIFTTKNSTPIFVEMVTNVPHETNVELSLVNNFSSFENFSAQSFRGKTAVAKNTNLSGTEGRTFYDAISHSIQGNSDQIDSNDSIIVSYVKDIASDTVFGNFENLTLQAETDQVTVNPVLTGKNSTRIGDKSANATHVAITKYLKTTSFPFLASSAFRKSTQGFQNKTESVTSNPNFRVVFADDKFHNTTYDEANDFLGSINKSYFNDVSIVYAADNSKIAYVFEGPENVPFKAETAKVTSNETILTVKNNTVDVIAVPRSSLHKINTQIPKVSNLGSTHLKSTQTSKEIAEADIKSKNYSDVFAGISKFHNVTHSEASNFLGMTSNYYSNDSSIDSEAKNKINIPVSSENITLHTVTDEAIFSFENYLMVVTGMSHYVLNETVTEYPKVSSLPANFTHLKYTWSNLENAQAVTKDFNLQNISLVSDINYKIYDGISVEKSIQNKTVIVTNKNIDGSFSHNATSLLKSTETRGNYADLNGTGNFHNFPYGTEDIHLYAFPITDNILGKIPEDNTVPSAYTFKNRNFISANGSDNSEDIIRKSFTSGPANIDKTPFITTSFISKTTADVFADTETLDILENVTLRINNTLPQIYNNYANLSNYITYDRVNSSTTTENTRGRGGSLKSLNLVLENSDITISSIKLQDNDIKPANMTVSEDIYEKNYTFNGDADFVLNRTTLALPTDFTTENRIFKLNSSSSMLIEHGHLQSACDDCNLTKSFENITSYPGLFKTDIPYTTSLKPDIEFKDPFRLPSFNNNEYASVKNDSNFNTSLLIDTNSNILNKFESLYQKYMKNIQSLEAVIKNLDSYGIKMHNLTTAIENVEIYNSLPSTHSPDIRPLVSNCITTSIVSANDYIADEEISSGRKDMMLIKQWPLPHLEAMFVNDYFSDFGCMLLGEECRKNSNKDPFTVISKELKEKLYKGGYVSRLAAGTVGAYYENSNSKVDIRQLSRILAAGDLATFLMWRKVEKVVKAILDMVQSPVVIYGKEFAKWAITNTWNREYPEDLFNILTNSSDFYNSLLDAAYQKDDLGCNDTKNQYSNSTSEPTDNNLPQGVNSDALRPDSFDQILENNSSSATLSSGSDQISLFYKDMSTNSASTERVATTTIAPNILEEYSPIEWPLENVLKFVLNDFS